MEGMNISRIGDVETTDVSLILTRKCLNVRECLTDNHNFTSFLQSFLGPVINPQFLSTSGTVVAFYTYGTNPN